MLDIIVKWLVVVEILEELSSTITFSSAFNIWIKNGDLFILILILKYRFSRDSLIVVF